LKKIEKFWKKIFLKSSTYWDFRPPLIKKLKNFGKNFRKQLCPLFSKKAAGRGREGDYTWGSPRVSPSYAGFF
jgi:hypothetical protein